MRRRAPKPPAVPHAYASNRCRALVRVDGSAIRNKIRREYEKALRDLEKARQALDQFQQRDQPQFSRWMSSHFGALLTELRELNLKMAADEAIIFMVQGEVMFGGSSYARAYKRVMELKEEPEPPPTPPPGGEREGRRDPFGAERGWGEPENPDEELDALFEELFDEAGPKFDPRTQRGSRAGPGGGRAAPADASKRVKELYRAVVRRLHPDAHREMTAQRTEWWHQAQAAYEAGDAEQLETILTLCQIGESGTTAHTSVSLLQRITAQLKSSLRAMKRQINRWRREPAWNFSMRTDLVALAEQVRRELTAELTAVRREWMRTQELIGEWKAAAERLKPTRRRRAQRPSPEFPF